MSPIATPAVVPDVWDFPGGHVQPGEHPEAALRRELAEELGIELEDLEVTPFSDESIPRQVGPHRVDSHRWRGAIANRQPEEHDAIDWFQKGQLDGLSFADPAYLTLLQSILTVA